MNPEHAIATLAAGCLEHLTDQEQRLVMLDALHSVAKAAGFQEQATTALEAAAHLRLGDELQLRLFLSPDGAPAGSTASSPR